MIYDLVPENDEMLKQELDAFDFTNPPVDPIELAKNLTETMLSKDGIGLAANQVGLPYRVFVVAANPVLAIFNPNIVDYSDEEIVMEEGCLSYPGYYIKIKRPKNIKIRFTMPNGEVVTRLFSGMTSRIIQHEYDHVEGVIYKTRASAYHREKANKDHKLFMRKLKNANR